MGRALIVAVALVLGACGSPAPAPVARPAPSSPSPAASPTPSAVPSPVVVRHAFPVAGKADYGHSHHDYPATDIFAACGTAYVAPVDGVALEIGRVDTWDAKVNDGATRGGLNISILGDDGIRYYSAHFSAIEPFLQPGTRVSAGQKLATVGRTGDTTVCHVHFGLSPVCMRLADWWIRRGVIWPWSYLDAWRGNDNKSPVAEITAWQAKNGCPTTPTAP